MQDSRDKDPSGSTIPQQLAKNLFTNGDRSAWRKLVEADYAFLLSGTASRRRILESYANIIEFGPGVYGMCAASWYYYNKPPAQLTSPDMATLVGLMPDPKHYTIYPTTGTVRFARKHAGERVEGLKSLPKEDLNRLFDLHPTSSEPSCSSIPDSLKDHFKAMTTPSGHAKYGVDDQSWWPRLTRQYADGKLPASTRVDRCKLARLVEFTPGASKGRARAARELASCAPG